MLPKHSSSQGDVSFLKSLWGIANMEQLRTYCDGIANCRPKFKIPTLACLCLFLMISVVEGVSPEVRFSFALASGALIALLGILKK